MNNKVTVVKKLFVVQAVIISPSFSPNYKSIRQGTVTVLTCTHHLLWMDPYVASCSLKEKETKMYSASLTH